MPTRTLTVYAFMDESGDAGMNLRKGASPYFVVVFVETTEPEILREQLRDLRAEFNLPRTFEFRYHDTRMTWAREAFFTLFRSLDVRVRAAVVDKAQLSEEAQMWSEREMYQYAIGAMVSHSSPEELCEAVLVIDGERAKQEFVRALRIYLSQLSDELWRDRIFKNIVLKEARREDGLQFADMVAGVLAERVEHGKSAYADAVAEKTIILLRLPSK